MKQKTKKAFKKRFELTAGGKLLSGHAYSSHLKRKKTKRRIRRQKEPAIVSPGFQKKIKRFLGG